MFYNPIKNHPEAIFVQLTTGCNAKCTSCPHPFTYGNEGHHKAGNMSQQTWDEFVRQVADAGYRGQVGLYLHHEPLLVKSLGRKIKDINERTKAYVVLSTNGALLTEDRRQELIEAKPRQVHVNMSSADPEQYSDIMKLDWEVTRINTHAFIKEAGNAINIEINCPVLPGVDTTLLEKEFPTVKVNAEYYANSRGGLLDDVSAEGMGSRFKIATACDQPSQNFNVLFDGSVIVCCMDWEHESKSDFPTIFEQDMFATYGGATMKGIRREFNDGDYSRYKMCTNCAQEMGFNVGVPIRRADQLKNACRKLVRSL
ncbi:radical SAM/SPASM domain-containing protein [Croceicoccus bisphenolivorans]|uniref:radical SAM/SPASM domain-containing protein n=1 Tax=Croceicoccus bisphenolivorans TaxID=1783232 RepID=UPI00082F0C34|nr:radical SAM/SPASM domain-containing protein [Croceicoccus bisphenolivorans]